MTGVIALIVVAAAVFLMLYSESVQKNKMEEQLHVMTGSRKFLYGNKANLVTGGSTVRGYFALTEDCLYFAEAQKKGGLNIRLQLRYEEIITHKLHFNIFIETADHNVYEIKLPNNAAAYNTLTKKLGH